MGSHFDASAQSAPFRVLVLGGCYGGLSATLNLIDLAEGRAARQGNGVVPGHDGKVPIEVTVVDERDGFYHLIGSPLALADEAYASKAWVKYADIPALQSPKITVLQGTVTAVDSSAKKTTILEAETQTSRELTYDYLIVSTGLRRSWPTVPQSLRRKQYLLETGAHIDTARSCGPSSPSGSDSGSDSPSPEDDAAAGPGVVVVGGGAVGIEMAAELKVVHPRTRVTLVHSRERLLSSEPLPDECKDRALELLREAGVETRMGKRLAGTREVASPEGGRPLTEISFTDGETMRAGQVIMAVSKAIPSTGFLPREAIDEEGYVKVRPNLMFPEAVPNADSHFAIGDAIRWSGIKRCGGAMHMGYSVAHNVHELVLQKIGGAEPKLQELAEVPPMIGLAVGKKAVSYGPAQGVMSGEDVMKAFFGNDLGFDICWNYMKLGEKTGLPKGSLIEG